MKSALLKDLLDLGDAFEQAHPNPAAQTLSAFLAWAAAQRPGAAGTVGAGTEAAGGGGAEVTLSAALPPVPAPDFQYYAPEVPVLQTYLAHMATKAHRYFRGYVKRAFEAVPLLNFDEFITLAILAERGSLTKTHLVEMTINEKTSGMLVIKRLIDNGYVLQTDDAHDRRSRRIAVTALGLDTLRAAQVPMNQATGRFAGDLSEDEQRHLSALLTRLDKFHEPIYLAHMAHREVA